jgi:hypothetical protein
VWYQSVSALPALLDVCDVMFAEDLEDAYHLSAFAGCTGELRWSWVLTLDSDGNIARAWRLVLGCDPTTCLGFCDKAMSGFCIDGFVARFAAAHFGQRNAGSPLNAFMRAVLRFLTSRHPPATTIHPLAVSRSQRSSGGVLARWPCTAPVGLMILSSSLRRLGMAPAPAWPAGAVCVPSQPVALGPRSGSGTGWLHVWGWA